VQAFLAVMKALSDPNRVKIVKMLQRRSLCVCEIRTALGISQPSASKHLRVLEKTGIVGSRKDGLWVNYFLSEGEASPYVASLLGNLRHWLGDDGEVQALLARLPRIRREDICQSNGLTTNGPQKTGRGRRSCGVDG